MTTTDGQVASTNPTSTHLATGLTVGWLVKRSALWLLIVATAVSAACLLYAAAGSADQSPSADATAGAPSAEDPAAVTRPGV